MSTADQDFEKPLVELRRRIEEIQSYPDEVSHREEIERLQKAHDKLAKEVYAKLDNWEKTLVARHFERPFTLDYVHLLCEDWVEIHGDRGFADDPAIVAGMATFRGRSVALVGHQKGRGTKERIHRNFGQPRPEGYRKALRLFHLAERFRLPVLTFVDTPGAYPGIGAEERGQAEAIARNLREMASLRVPIVVTITGEGGSGGALALGVGNRVYMLQYSVYSVISPEGCAAILWKDQGRKVEAAAALKLTAPELEKLGVIDGVIEEPMGGAHLDPRLIANRVGDRIEGALESLDGLAPSELVADRVSKFRAMGAFEGRVR
ncbi:MAG: acetyl-CoA carboxylase carboxyltransferase subunit alpha [Holophagales bacterium]|nr:acetyl-CoA carboxylase carboxyltransferase subunit alpha [Holophagales bacterium]